jgi:mercuric ion binding protein
MAAVPGVSAVEMDFNGEEASVRYDDYQATPDDIAKASTNAGYPASLNLQQP